MVELTLADSTEVDLRGAVLWVWILFVWLRLEIIQPGNEPSGDIGLKFDYLTSGMVLLLEIS